MGGQAQKAGPAWRPRQLLVRWRPATGKDRRLAVLAECGARSLRHVARFALEQVSLPPDKDLDRTARCLAANPLVAAVGKNYLRYPQGVDAPNDPAFDRQWAAPFLGIDRLWPLVSANNEIVIGVIDTGILRHPDLAANFWQNEAEAAGRPGVDDDGNGKIDDVWGWDFGEDDADPFNGLEHAAGVAGIIAAQGDNGMGIAGVLWQARIANLKATDAAGIMDVAAVAAAVDYALAIPGLRILNCSFGGFGQDTTGVEEAAFRALADAGVLVICASGNQGKDIDADLVSGNGADGFYPAGYRLANMLTVAAVDQDGRLAAFSNYGPRTVHCAAPGDRVVTLGRPATQAAVTVAGVSYQAVGMEYAGLTEAAGVRGLLVDGGYGYVDELPENVRGAVLFVLRGGRNGETMTFRQKAENAEAAGAVALVVANDVDPQTDPADALDTVGGTLGGPGITIPVVSISKAAGESVRAAGMGGEAVVVNVLDPSQVVVQSGTSFAAPFVTGIAAMILAVRPELSALQLKEALLATVRPLPALTEKVAANGVVDAWAALAGIWPRGDVDGDRRVRLADAVLGLQVWSGRLTPLLPLIGDVDGDGRIGAAEVLRALQTAAGNE